MQCAMPSKVRGCSRRPGRKSRDAAGRMQGEARASPCFLAVMLQIEAWPKRNGGWRMKSTSAMLVLVMLCGCGGGFPTPTRTERSSAGFDIAAARKALNDVKKVQTRTEVGISLVKYRDAVSDMWVEVKPYLQSPQGSIENEFNRQLRAACEHYRDAIESWQKAIDCNLAEVAPDMVVPSPKWTLASMAIEKAEKALGD